jgi:hypothetical protein
VVDPDNPESPTDFASEAARAHAPGGLLVFPNSFSYSSLPPRNHMYTYDSLETPGSPAVNPASLEHHKHLEHLEHHEHFEHHEQGDESSC